MKSILKSVGGRQLWGFKRIGGLSEGSKFGRTIKEIMSTSIARWLRVEVGTLKNVGNL